MSAPPGSQHLMDVRNVGSCMPHQRQKLGDYGEAIAAAHLERHGYRLLARKWRCRYGEIDLIAHSGTELVFIEIRTRRGAGSPAESVGRAKQRRLIELAQRYIQSAEVSAEAAWRIDVIAIMIGPDGRVASLDHIINAVEEH